MIRKTIILLWCSIYLSNAKAAERFLFIPDGALGVLQISDLVVGTLPLLKGIKGDGRYLTYNNQGQLCEVYPIPFLAGGFNGRNIGVEHGAKEVVIEVYSKNASERLKQANEVTSIDFRTERIRTNLSELVVTSGLAKMEAFILHPQRIWSSWWQYKKTELPCRPVDSVP